MKKLLFLFLLITNFAFGQVTPNSITTNTNAARADYMLMYKAAGGAGSGRIMTVDNFLRTFSVVVQASLTATGSGTIGGSGTANFYSKWVSSTTLTSGYLKDLGLNTIQKSGYYISGADTNYTRIFLGDDDNANNIFQVTTDGGVGTTSNIYADTTIINLNTTHCQVSVGNSGIGGLGVYTGSTLAQAIDIDNYQNVGFLNDVIVTGSFVASSKFKYTDGNQGSGKVLTSDASGNATWQTASGGTSTYTATTIYSGNSNITITSNNGNSVGQTFTVTIVNSPAHSGTVTAGQFIGDLRPNTTATFTVATSATVTIASFTGSRQQYSGSGSATAFMIHGSNINDGQMVRIYFSKTTASDCTITFPTGTVVSVSGGWIVSGLTGKLQSTTSGTFTITLENYGGTYVAYCTQNVD